MCEGNLNTSGSKQIKSKEKEQEREKINVTSLMSHLNDSQYQAEPNTIKLCLKQ